MQRDRALCTAVFISAAWAGVAGAADESGLTLAEGPGRERAQSACSMCHSLDYILINAPFQDRAAWEKTVVKMVTVFGAPLTADDEAAIVAYLVQHYGPSGNDAPKP